MKRSLMMAVSLCAATMLSAPSFALLAAPLPDSFTFTGICSDCTGSTATLLNYGTDLSLSNFVSFTYSSSVLQFTITKPNAFSAQGDLSGPIGPKPVSISGYSGNGFYSFSSSSDGVFNVELNFTNNDTGEDHTWAPSSSNVPEPASWAMMVAGFGVVGGAMRRRARTTVRFA